MQGAVAITNVYYRIPNADVGWRALGVGDIGVSVHLIVSTGFGYILGSFRDFYILAYCRQHRRRADQMLSELYRRQRSGPTLPIVLQV